MESAKAAEKPGTILVTGGSGGLGRALIADLSASGYATLNWSRNPPAQLHFGETFERVDLASAAEVQSACAALSENLRADSQLESPLVGFVHSAGYGGPYHKITEVSFEDWENIFSVNLRSAFQITKALLPSLAQREFGRLVYVASTLAVQGSALSVAYSASKHGLIGFMKSVAAEWGEKGVTANIVSPGFFETKMGVQENQVDDHRNKIIAMTPVRKIAAPSEIARVIRFLLSADSSYVNGANWTVDGGITAI